MEGEWELERESRNTGSVRKAREEVENTSTSLDSTRNYSDIPGTSTMEMQVL